eukprot:8509637-Pyramimonas_sp.AAC.1
MAFPPSHRASTEVLARPAPSTRRPSATREMCASPQKVTTSRQVTHNIPYSEYSQSLVSKLPTSLKALD